MNKDDKIVMEIPYKMVFDWQLARFLIKNCGFYLFDVRENHNDPHNLIFFFKDSITIKRSIEYFNSNNKNTDNN